MNINDYVTYKMRAGIMIDVNAQVYIQMHPQLADHSWARIVFVTDDKRQVRIQVCNQFKEDHHEH
jgi:hypothetical protein